MPPERYPPDDPREWLNRARSNLARAKTETPGAYFEDICFDAQQAAEKAIKAVLLAHRVDFPYVHDLGWLLSVVAATGADVPVAVKEAGRLTRYALVTRYPGGIEPVTEEEYRRAVAIAAAVVGWAEARVEAERTRAGS